MNNFSNLNYLKSELKKISHHFELKDFDYVIQKSIILIKKNPKQIPFYNFLGLAYRQKGKLYLAEKILYEAHKMEPNNINVLTNLASVYRHLEDFSKSIKYFEIGYKNNPNNVNLLCNYANLKRDLNDIKGSIKLYKKAFDNNNNLPIVLQNIAGSYQIIGEFENSKKYLKKLINNFPEMTLANKMLSDVIDYNKDDSHQKEMLINLNNKSYSEEQKIPFYFALAKSYDDQKYLAKSFNYTNQGNIVSKKIITKNGYSIKREINQFSYIKKIFENTDLNKINNKKKLGNNLIFILGLPRSGTTITHQIIASHSKVYGAGELTLLDQLIEKNLNNMNFLNIFKDNSEKNNEKIIEIAETYINKFNFFKTEKSVFLDKSPLNFRFIGFIKVLFPNAKIIHCTRNLKDTALSIYKNTFDGFSLAWSYNEDDIIKYISLYLDLMKFWNEKIPGFIYESNYEELVNNQEIQSKKIFDFCNLSWESKVLKFFNTDTPIKTASIKQARGPIYKSSINSSKKYSKYLDFYKKLDRLESKID